MANRILVKGGSVITVDPDLGDLPQGDVLVIVAVVPNAKVEGAAVGRPQPPTRALGRDDGERVGFGAGLDQVPPRSEDHDTLGREGPLAVPSGDVAGEATHPVCSFKMQTA